MMFRSIVGAVARRFSRAKQLVRQESFPVLESVLKAPSADERAEAAGVNFPETNQDLLNPFEPVAIATLPSPAKKGFLIGVFEGSERNGNGARDLASIPDPSGVDAVDEHPWTPENVTIPGPTEDALVESDPAPHRGRDVSDSEIQMLAYLKWEAAGKPKGRGHEARFWLEATQELGEKT